MHTQTTRIVCALVVSVALERGAALAAGSLRCLTGTDPSVATDAAQIRTVRNLVEASCVCAAFDGATGKKHSDYVRCANTVIKAQAALPPGNLRRQCKGTVHKVYVQSTCGMNPALHVQPCVKTATATGKVSCAIKPTTKADGVSSNDRCVNSGASTAVGCAGIKYCLDAADSNGDLLVGVGDDGVCVPLGGNRPVTVHVPPSYAPATPMPLVVMLHGYSASGTLEEFYLGLTAVSDQRGFLYVHPDGTIDGIGNRFWNATDACCNFSASTVDDSLYLSNLIAGVAARYSVDAKRVYIFGHSNGAFMAYRMACDHSGQIAAIVSLAGAMFDDISNCTAANPVSVLQVHGTADATILYNGGSLGHPYPGALTSVADWVSINGCTNVPDLSAPPLDLDTSLVGAETTVTQYAAGCAAGSAVDLWTINGGSHIPPFTPQFAPDAIDFLFAHPKP